MLVPSCKPRQRDGRFALATKRPLEADADECRANPRARSAKLRVAERVRSETSLYGLVRRGGRGVIRVRLCALLAALTLVVGLVTAIVQSHNRDLGMRLADLRAETSLIEAVNGASTARLLALDHGPLDPDHYDPKKKAAR